MPAWAMGRSRGSAAMTTQLELFLPSPSCWGVGWAKSKLYTAASPDSWPLLAVTIGLVVAFRLYLYWYTAIPNYRAWAIAVTPVVCVSYAWLRVEHPDEDQHGDDRGLERHVARLS